MDADAATRMATLIDAKYGELRTIARSVASGRSPGAAIQPTALVHEAFLRLNDQAEATARGSTFFKRCFAQECRRILVDAARARRTLRRGGDRHAEALIESGSVLGTPDAVAVLQVHDAIATLARLNPRMGTIAEMRLFGGMTVAECAEALGLAVRTVEKDWTFVRGWLRKEFAEQ